MRPKGCVKSVINDEIVLKRRVGMTPAFPSFSGISATISLEPITCRGHEVLRPNDLGVATTRSSVALNYAKMVRRIAPTIVFIIIVRRLGHRLIDNGGYRRDNGRRSITMFR